MSICDELIIYSHIPPLYNVFYEVCVIKSLIGVCNMLKLYLCFTVFTLQSETVAHAMI